MRLLNVNTRELEQFFDDAIPPYVTLSHRWETKEVTFRDLHDNPLHVKKAGYPKIDAVCCAVVQRTKEVDYVWIDTCCIDKSSSAELTEAINSMYEWYLRSCMCFMYLLDVPSAEARHGAFAKPESAFRKSGNIIVYSIPGKSGSIEHGDRVRNFCWYTNIPVASLVNIMTDVEGKRHHTKLAPGKVRPES
ncbi:heterokaryon incompatibility protein-domain-containing protein [Xylaria telfairii]|nr:heterokaryon incompatibility protein-domain-containing protein [Xylaria telfairii]